MTPEFFGLVAMGLFAGAFGTLIGAGGGIVVMPILLLFYHDSPAELTTISLAMICFNAASATQAYARMKRIDYVSAISFALATIPGAVIGALTVKYVPMTLFNVLMGALLVGVSIFLMLRPDRKPKSAAHIPGHARRTLTDATGQTYTYSFNLGVGVVLAFGVGFLSSLLGIGGGIIHVPSMIYLLSFPVYVATATSSLVLLITALAGTVTHLAAGDLVASLWWRILPLAIGVIPGAQLGARLSKRIKGKWIIRCLALALTLAGGRILLKGAGVNFLDLLASAWAIVQSVGR
jgi:uncharacterized membrane protein YfcA